MTFDDVTDLLSSFFFLNGTDKMIDEKTLTKEYDEIKGLKGSLNNFLYEKGVNLSQFLHESNRFDNCGNGLWKIVLNEKRRRNAPVNQDYEYYFDSNRYFDNVFSPRSLRSSENYEDFLNQFSPSSSYDRVSKSSSYSDADTEIDLSFLEYSHSPPVSPTKDLLDIQTDSYEFTAPLVPKSFQKWNEKYVKITMSHFMDFKKFGVRAVENIDEFKKMDRKIQNLMKYESRSVECVPKGGWKPNYGCLVRITDQSTSNKWLRGIIIRRENENFRVYLLDISKFMLLEESEMKVMPREYRKISSFSIRCTLFASEDEQSDLYYLLFNSELLNNFENMFIEMTGDYKIIDGIMVFFVNFFLETLNGSRKNILDFIE